MFSPGKIINRGRIASVCQGLTVIVLLGFCATGGKSASVFYPDQGPVPPGVTFTDIAESSGTDPVPLYGAPSAFPVGLDFDPMSFVAFASGGGIDITDGQLNFTVQGETMSQLVGISSISLLEAGDYTLAGTGTSATQAFAAAIMRIAVTQIDGLDVSPILLVPVNASVGFALPPTVIIAPWSLGLTLNVASQLTGLGIPFTAGATRLEVVIDNQLIALSEASSLAEIAKKEFKVEVIPNVVPVPEPTTCLLLGIGLITAVASRRREREPLLNR